MIQTNKLTKIYRTEDVETYALNEVDLHIREGEFVSVMGPSGCGKSTLLHILGLLDTPNSGSYRIHGTEVSGLTPVQRTRFIKENIGFVFQRFILMDELNVFNNISLPLKYHNISARERRKRVNTVMQRMRIRHRSFHYPKQLSGGQQQRVALARAVVTQPNLILADEPTGNLDSKNGIEVMNLLSELNREGATIVMVTHSERDAGFAHRTVRLFDGRIETDEDHYSLHTDTNALSRAYSA
jgi:putative ABC transport system ATP-binding protein